MDGQETLPSVERIAAFCDRKENEKLIATFRKDFLEDLSAIRLASPAERLSELQAIYEELKTEEQTTETQKDKLQLVKTRMGILNQIADETKPERATGRGKRISREEADQAKKDAAQLSPETLYHASGVANSESSESTSTLARTCKNASGSIN